MNGKSLTLTAIILIAVCCNQKSDAPGLGMTERRAVICGLVPELASRLQRENIDLEQSKQAWQEYFGQQSLVSAFSDPLLLDDLIGIRNDTLVDGAFRFEFSLSGPQEILVRYLNGDIRLIAYPGDSIYLEIGNAIPRLQRRHTEYEGDRKILNQLVGSFHIDFAQEFLGKIAALSNYQLWYEFLEKRKALEEAMLAFREDFLKSYDVQNQVFEDWSMDYISYLNGADLVSYSKTDPMDDPFGLKPLPAQYFQSLLDYPIENFSEVRAFHYSQFLKLHLDMELSGIRMSKYYQSCRSDPNCNEFAFEWEQLRTIPVEEVKGTYLLLTVLYNKYPENRQDIIDAVNMLQGEQIRHRVMEIMEMQTEDAEENTLVNASLQLTDRTPESLFQLLTNGVEKGKIFLLWNGYEETPIFHEVYADEIRQAEESGFEIIYLCHHMPEVLWKNLIIRNKLKGEHWLINHEQYQYFFDRCREAGFISRFRLIREASRMYLGRITDYPSFLFITHNGEIVLSAGPGLPSVLQSIFYLQNVPNAWR